MLETIRKSKTCKFKLYHEARPDESYTYFVRQSAPGVHKVWLRRFNYLYLGELYWMFAYPFERRCSEYDTPALRMLEEFTSGQNSHIVCKLYQAIVNEAEPNDLDEELYIVAGCTGLR